MHYDNLLDKRLKLTVHNILHTYNNLRPVSMRNALPLFSGVNNTNRQRITNNKATFLAFFFLFSWVFDVKARRLDKKMICRKINLKEQLKLFGFGDTFGTCLYHVMIK